jgi:hypothetical protein
VCHDKRSTASHQTRTCKAGALETPAHALLDCEFYNVIRPPLRAAAGAWCRDTGIGNDTAGCAAALWWADTGE